MAVGRFAPSPPGPSTSGTCAPRCWPGSSPARPAAGSSCAIEDLDPVTSSREHEAGQLADLAALGPRLGRAGRAPVRRGARPRGGPRRARRARASPTRASAAAERCARRARRPTCRPGPTRGRAATSAPPRPPQRERRGPARRRCACAATGEPVTIVDRLRGEVTRPADDIVLRRNDGVPAYHVAVVVDDDDQGVEEVVRGDDLLDATPSQAHLLDLLGRPRPTWAHVPLVLGPDGAAAGQAPRRGDARRPGRRRHRRRRGAHDSRPASAWPLPASR